MTLGLISEVTIRMYYESQDRRIYFIKETGFGIYLSEAMHCGLPIAAINNGGQTDFLINGRNALLVSAEEEDVLTQKIAELIKDKAIQSAISANNRKDITNFYIDKVSK
jgi:glycosyltransferase involved in cell wall biosynthesis